MNRFLYAEANPWTFSDPSGHATCYSSSDLCDETMAIKHQGTPGGQAAAKRTANQDRLVHIRRRLANYWSHQKTLTRDYDSSPEATPAATTCSSSICNQSAPSTSREVEISTWQDVDLSKVWSELGKSSCTASDPCVPGLACPIMAGPCMVAPWSNPVSEYECDAECQAEGFRLTAVLVGVSVGTYACAVACPQVAAAVGTGGLPLLDKIKDKLPTVTSSGWGPSLPSVTNPQLKTLVDQLYRQGATIGNGGTADAIRAGAGHVQKGGDYIVALSRWLAANPDADASDISAAETMLTDLLAAMAGQSFPGAK